MSHPEENFGSQEGKVDGFIDRLLLKRTREQVGDGHPYRSAVVERETPTFLGNLVIQHGTKLMVLGVLAGLAGTGKAVEAMWPQDKATPNNTDVTVVSVKFHVDSSVCDNQQIEDCYVDAGNGLNKIPLK